jgi:hypothetical protein
VKKKKRKKKKKKETKKSKWNTTENLFPDHLSSILHGALMDGCWFIVATQISIV